MCGGSGGTKHIIDLQCGEHITMVEGQYSYINTRYGSNSVTQLTFTTNYDVTHGPYGRLNFQKEAFSFNPSDGKVLVGMTSNDDTYVENVTFYFDGKPHSI